jgi:pimeloyl-ACP methyl ester carboxylesterase
MKNYRREVLLGRALAARGIACARFHYRGVGHSEGDPGALDISSMAEDAVAVADHLRTECGVTDLVFIGTRLGAVAAARAAAKAAGEGLVLWDPVLDPPRYFKEVFRSRLLAELRTGGGGSTKQLLDELLSVGTVEVLGFPIGRSAYESALGSSMVEAVGLTSGPILVVQFNQRDESRSEDAAIGSQLGIAGRDMQVEVFRHKEAWWFAENVARFDHTGHESAPLVQLTAHWVAGRFAPAAEVA